MWLLPEWRKSPRLIPEFQFWRQRGVNLRVKPIWSCNFKTEVLFLQYSSAVKLSSRFTSRLWRTSEIVTGCSDVVSFQRPTTYNPTGWINLHFKAFSGHFCPKRLTVIYTLMVVVPMQDADQLIWSRSGFSILPKDTLTCRPGDSNQRSSDNKMLALPSEPSMLL